MFVVEKVWVPGIILKYKEGMVWNLKKKYVPDHLQNISESG